MYATKVSDRVYLLDTFALGQQGTVGAYLVKGPKPALVDCGYATSYQNVLAGLAEVGIMPSEVRYLIPTHVHLDHAGAAGRLLREMPRAEVLSHEKGVPHLVDPTRLIESATKVFGEELMKLYGNPEPIPEGRVTPVGAEGNLDLGEGMTASMIHTPGHAPHQISVLINGSKDLLTADAVGIVYPGMKSLIPTTPPPSFRPDQLLASVETLRQMSPKELLVPHYGVRRDAEWVFGKTSEMVASWVDSVKEMVKEGMDLDGISKRMETEVVREEGGEDIPIYAKVSVRTSVMGIIHYLEKNS
jgi:glyoxylase-like metal-dependent hydrolase (beta-lactamase superfamily II)